MRDMAIKRIFLNIKFLMGRGRKHIKRCELDMFREVNDTDLKKKKKKGIYNP